ncbi:PQQ-dependent sugar dehydrogenase [Adhaeretor mobilis]|nr:PQQ-dependent sugar dehydrogenase [Adhaeretor mobilis]
MRLAFVTAMLPHSQQVAWGVDLRAEPVITTGFSNPVFGTAAPGQSGTLYVSEQNAVRISILDLQTQQSSTFLDLEDFAGTQSGLQTFAFHPDYVNNGRVYLNLFDSNTNDIKIIEFTRSVSDPLVADMNSMREILTIPNPTGSHNGGWLGFSPVDNQLYIATGDGGTFAGPDKGLPAQDTFDVRGKVLRIDVDGDDFPTDSGRNYAIPASNPFATLGGAPEVFAYGLRHPFRASFDRANGDLFLGDVGSVQYEEINFIPAGTTGGQNFGWRALEGDVDVPFNSDPHPPNAIPPIFSYPHGSTAAVIGGYVYRGSAIPDLHGAYFYADVVRDEFGSFRYDGTSVSEFVDRSSELLNPLTPTGSYNGIVSFAEDSEGELYFFDRVLGDIFKIVADEIQTTDWINSAGGDYDTAANWNPENVPDDPLSERARFSLPETMTVAFSSTSTTIADLTVSAGNVTFRVSGTTADATLQADDDIVIDGGSLSLAQVDGATFDVHLAAADELLISGGATLTVGDGSTVDADSIELGASSSGNGTLVVNGSGSALTVTGLAQVGNKGDAGALSISNGANAAFASSLEIVGGTDNNTTGSLEVLSGATVTVSGDIELGAGSGLSASLTIDGVGSLLTQSTAGAFTIGNGNGDNTADLVIAGGGQLTTGDGTTTIYANGNVNIDGSSSSTINGPLELQGGSISATNGGVLTTHGNVTITAGLVDTAGGEFLFAGDKSIAITSGGSFSTSSDLTIGNSLVVDNGGTVNQMAGTFDLVAASGSTTVLVDGLDSQLVAGGAGESSWAADSGADSTATFSNESISTLTNVNLGADSVGAVVVDVTSGAELSFEGQWKVAPGSTGTTTLTVSGAGSRLTVNDPDDSQFSSTPGAGSAVLHILPGGTFTKTAGTLEMGPNSSVNLDGGTIVLDEIQGAAGAVNFTRGTFSTNSDLTIGLSGLFASDNLTLQPNDALATTGIATIAAFSTLTLAGGELSVGELVNSGSLNFNAGLLAITSAGGLNIAADGLLGESVALQNGQHLSVTNTLFIDSSSVLVVENGSSASAGLLENNGSVILGGTTSLFGGTQIANRGVLRGNGRITAMVTNEAQGEIRIDQNNTIMLTGANGINSGRISLLGGTIHYSQALTNGVDGDILGRGTLVVDGLGLINEGDLTYSNGQSDFFGDLQNQNAGRVIVSGGANVTFWNDVFHTGASFQVSSQSSATFFGEAGFGVSGGGDVYFEADITPGSSPGLELFDGNVYIGELANLEIEIGGSVSGSEFDVLQIAGTAELGGVLNVSLLDGFSPRAGDSFEFMTSAEGVVGTFATTALPTLATNLMWNLLYEPNAVSLTVGIPGDYNGDGALTVADYTLWRDNLGVSVILPNDLTPGIVIAEDYDVWRSSFFDQAASGSSATAVPETATLCLLIGGLALATSFRSRRCR